MRQPSMAGSAATQQPGLPNPRTVRGAHPTLLGPPRPIRAPTCICRLLHLALPRGKVRHLPSRLLARFIAQVRLWGPAAARCFLIPPLQHRQPLLPLLRPARRGRGAGRRATWVHAWPEQRGAAIAIALEVGLAPPPCWPQPKGATTHTLPPQACPASRTHRCASSALRSAFMSRPSCRSSAASAAPRAAAAAAPASPPRDSTAVAAATAASAGGASSLSAAARRRAAAAARPSHSSSRASSSSSTMGDLSCRQQG